MKKRIFVWALGSISVALFFLSIIVFNAARSIAGGAEDELAVTALLKERSTIMMLLSLFFGALAVAVGYFQKRSNGRPYR
jgi:hypothetical protein